MKIYADNKDVVPLNALSTPASKLYFTLIFKKMILTKKNVNIKKHTEQ